MADIRLMRHKVDVRIRLWPQDMIDIFQQPEVLSGMTKEELGQLIQAMQQELTNREKQDVVGTKNPQGL